MIIIIFKSTWHLGNDSKGIKKGRAATIIYLFGSIRNVWCVAMTPATLQLFHKCAPTEAGKLRLIKHDLD